jgi:TalC/MipB family fructose-6-phosphate aldolase
MSLYVDSAYLDDVTSISESFPIAGVTTNPSILLRALERGQTLDDLELLHRLLDVTSGLVFMQATAPDSEHLHAAAARYIDFDPERVVPKLPPTEGGMAAGRELTRQGARVAYTATCTPAQVYCAAEAGATWAIPYYSRMTRAGVDPCERIMTMSRLLARQGAHTRLLAASVKSASDVTEALLAGAHDVTASPEVIMSLLRDPLSDQAFTQFAVDWSAFEDAVANGATSEKSPSTSR